MSPITPQNQPPNTLIISSSVPSTQTTTTSASAQFHAGPILDPSSLNISSTLRSITEDTGKPVLGNQWRVVNLDEAIISPQMRKLRHLQNVALKEFRPDIGRSDPGEIWAYDVFYTVSVETAEAGFLYEEADASASVEQTKDNNQEEIYHISEISSNVILNSTFQQFQLSSSLHSQSFILRIYVSRHGCEQWELSHEFTVNLSQLLYLGPLIDEISIPIGKPSATPLVLITLLDGVYILPPSLEFINSYRRVVSNVSESKSFDGSWGGNGRVPSLTYGDFLKLMSLEKYVCEIDERKGQLASEIESWCEEVLVRDVCQVRNKVMLLREAVCKCQDEVQDLETRVRDTAIDDNAQCEDQESKLRQVLTDFSTLQEVNDLMVCEISQIKSKLIHKLLTIIPISDQYTTATRRNTRLVSLPRLKISSFLPSTSPTSVNPNLPLLPIQTQPQIIDKELLNTTIGNLTHLLTILSRVFQIPVRYDIKYIGSYSFIIDSINSKLQSERFPLFVADWVNATETQSSQRQRQRLRYAIGLLNCVIQDLENGI
ncbi:hypothetical protein WICPIJ_009536 [Wickerhamomyces pijperi]|uniref:Uncharacterized protein n=1 Tax=Wickerhamomyces pijperi TaxID=599730 RepID=A0A9P8PLQ2_WICPI|nr:hypothetical protein WICPIJ_009536 [Wickerhamomyces pijperi]